MSSDSNSCMTSCLNLMRRMPPREVETDLYNLTRLMPSLADELYQRVDQPLQVAVDPVNGRKYLLCDYNRDGDSYRSPWTNQYDPPSVEGDVFFPSETVRNLEVQANEIFDSYRELYYQGGISSVYMWDLEPGFAACFLVKKNVIDQRFVEKGSWNSIHVIEVQESSDVLDKGLKKATYRLTTSVLLFMKVNRPELGDLSLDGTLTRQAERTMEIEDQFAHVSNMGRMVEDMEIDMRSSLDGLYISKTREVINGMRKLQQGPHLANPFVGELAGAVLKHGQKQQDQMLHLEDFFTHSDSQGFCAGSNAPKDTKLVRREEDGVKEGGVLYLHGPKDAGQTSLLLQFGFTQVKAGKNVVLVMCGNAGSSPSASDSEVVPLTACTTCKEPVQSGETNNIWRRINIKYLRNSGELQQFVCSLHINCKETSVVLVDGFEKFFADDSQMGNVYQTLAFMLEAQDYMKIATGCGIVVVTGKTDAFLLQHRPLLRRWCRFLELVWVVDEPHVFIMREEMEDKADVNQGVTRMQVRYEFAPESSGTFQLLHVQRCVD